MQLGIIGLPFSGKTTLFEALTGTGQDVSKKGEFRIGTIAVPDARVDFLSGMYHPQKTTYAKVQYVLAHRENRGEKSAEAEAMIAHIRACDALIHVVRNFSSPGMEAPSPLADFQSVDSELILADLMVVEKKLERVELDKKRGKKPDPEEYELLTACKACLDNETPLRHKPELAGAHKLRGYAFSSAKPMLVVFNNPDEDNALPEAAKALEGKETCTVVRCKLEQELVQMPEEEAKAFLEEFGLTETAMGRMIQQSYELLGLMSFFTVGEDEVRAWTVPKGGTALDAAGAIHTDLQKGFIRAEVLAYEDLKKAGSYAAARKLGTVRLEGKTYIVQDGDILHVRFNV